MLGVLKTDSPHFVLLTQEKLFRSKEPFVFGGKFSASRHTRIVERHLQGALVVRFRVLKGYWEKKSCKDDEPCAHRELRVLYYDANTSRVKWVSCCELRRIDTSRPSMGQALRRQWDHKTRNHFYWISAAEYRPCCQSLRKEVKRWHLPYGSGRPSVCPYRIACCGNCSQHPNFNSCDLIRCPDQQMQFETHYTVLHMSSSGAKNAALVNTGNSVWRN
uniref:Uncharacterized protein n=1 Tax=Coccidioides posadasii RMSCC 3488 TaxID=454284 RepID=A0A0J6FD59_COCPO|nr:hypothetical protein CPAG_04579 [Coccidioides posadasii RMSCC 3488]